jgi:hypothetical protein
MGPLQSREFSPSRLAARLGILAVCLAASGAQAWAQAKNACLDCHATLDPPLQITAESFAQDIHTQKGLTCGSCHGGDPATDDMERAMGRAAGFRGKIERAQIPALCSHCHSDAAYMRQFNPTLRTDQYSQYLTSVHGKRLATGDSKVAVCTDCHSVHGIRPASDSLSSVHPLNVAKTCGRCHADPEHMKGYGIPIDQFASYSSSVHHEALVERGDLSAPTCTTCHGNHGAAPPGVASVENVCSTCHAFQAQLFDGSPHKVAFTAMGLPGCVTCHSNHAILHPTDAMVGTSAGAVCVRCHSQGDTGFHVAAQMHDQLNQLQSAIASSDEVLDTAESSGMEISQSQMEQAEARDALTHARVTLHGFQLAPMEKDIQAGKVVAAKTLSAGQKALAERDYRRKGLALSLVTILVVLIGLRLYLSQLEKSVGSTKTS